MKIFLSAAIALLIGQAAFSMDWSYLTLDKINSDYQETNLNSFHTFGIFTYGVDDNTFHLREYYGRYNFTPISNFQFFVAVNGYMDTHNPDTNYTFILNNINLYDYGFYYLFLDHFFLSLRGSATYRFDMDTFLLIRSYYAADNPADFEAPPQYIPDTTGSEGAPGIRVGFTSEHFMFGYSQGDFRHAIPIVGLIQYNGEDDYYVRLTYKRVSFDPLTYIFTDFYSILQLSSAAHLKIGDFDLLGLAELTYSQWSLKSGWGGDYWIRLEQGVEWNKLIFAVREMYHMANPFLFEASIKYNFYSTAYLGVFAATDGRISIGSQVDF